MNRLAWLLGALLISSVALADAPPARAPLSGRALVEAASLQRRPGSMRISLQMTIKEASGTAWTRKASLITKQAENGRQMQVFSFLDPPALAGSAVLTREETGHAPAQWLYVPAYHAVRRIPAANIGDAYLGTDYFFEDVLDKAWDQYEFKDLGMERQGEATLTKVELRPKSAELKQSSSYSRTVYWIEPVRKVIVREEYFDKQGALLKVMKYALLKSYGKYFLWDAVVVENAQTGHVTVTQVVRREVDVPIEDDAFTERALKRNR
jgi:hypothetical protein